MKFPHIILILTVIASSLFAGRLYADDVSINRYLNGTLEACSSGIRGNACDHTSKQVPGDAGRVRQALTRAERDRVSYMSNIESKIATNFVLPPGVYNNLSASIIIKLSAFGNIRSDFEKRSGNMNFDKAAIAAVDAAGPFGHPPRELANTTIRVTFHP